MAKTFRRTIGLRFGNALFKAVLPMGIMPRHIALLTVTGRRTGRRYSTPVRVLDHGGQRWLVAPFGAVGWVLNARAVGEVTLRSRGRPQTHRVTECSPAESGPVLKAYAQAVPIARPYFDAAPDDPPERFAAEADRHPVFRIAEATAE